MFVLGAVLAGLVGSPTSGADEIVMPHDVGTRYTRIDYEAACGSRVFRVRFRNGPEWNGRVEQVRVDGRPVRGAAELLQLRAARRNIERIGILNCGPDEKRPVFHGVLALSEAESRRAGMRPLLFFRLSPEGRGDWRIAID